MIMSKGEDVIKNLALFKNLSRNGISLTNYSLFYIWYVRRAIYDIN